MRHSESITNIAAALVKAQRKMGAATKDAKNPFFKSKYADYGAVLEVVKDPLNENGITIIQSTSSEGEDHFVETTLIHETGEWISSGKVKLVLTKNDMQALGSAITYARRYQLQALLGIPAEDDDGESAVARPKKEDSPGAITRIPMNADEVTTKPIAETNKRPSFKDRAKKPEVAESDDF